MGLPSLTGFKTDEFLVLCLSVLYLIINFMMSLEKISVDIYYISNKIEVFSVSTVYFKVVVSYKIFYSSALYS